MLKYYLTGLLDWTAWRKNDVISVLWYDFIYGILNNFLKGKYDGNMVDFLF